MSTNLQKNLAENIVKNVQRDKPLNKQELLVSSGYSVISAESSSKDIIEQKGVQEELAKLGFTEEGAKSVVEEILYDKKVDASSRLRAAGEVFKVFGSYAAEKSFNLTVSSSVEEINDVIRKDLAKFRTNQ